MGARETLLQTELQEYYASPALSQSFLKLGLLDRPELYRNVRDEIQSELFFEEKQHFIIGSAVDCKLTTPILFEELYYVSTLINKPSDKIKSIIHEVISTATEAGLDLEHISLVDLRAYILIACDNHQYCMNWEEQTRINKIVENFSYYNEVILSRGKTILSFDDIQLINKIVRSLQTNIYTNKYITEEAIKESYGHNVEILYQKPIYFKLSRNNYDPLDCKALLDVVIIDHENKFIQPVDIKTMSGDTKDFIKSFKKRRYDIQAAWYNKALEKAYPGYRIASFVFVVESTTSPGYRPFVYACTDKLLDIGCKGKPFETVKVNGFDREVGEDTEREYEINQDILGYRDLIDRYLKAKENPDSYYTQYEISSRGVYMIDEDFEIF